MMLYGVVLYIVVVLLTVFAKTHLYVDAEAKQGVTRLLFVVVGTILLVLLVIAGIKMVFAAI